MVIESVSEPSVSVRADEMFSGIAVSSLPVASCTESVGVEAVRSNSTLATAVTDALSPSFSVAVAVTVTFRLPAMPSGTVTFSPSRLPVGTDHVPSAFLVPADSFAPSGMPPTTIDKLSDPSVSVNAAWMFSG